jgi:hypothetical protein
MCCPSHFGHLNEKGVELTTLNKRLLGGNPILWVYLLFLMHNKFKSHVHASKHPKQKSNREQNSELSQLAMASETARNCEQLVIDHFWLPLSSQLRVKLLATASSCSLGSFNHFLDNGVWWQLFLINIVMLVFILVLYIAVFC